MKNILKYLSLNLTLVLALASLGVLMSCEDDDVNTSEVELLSFGPSGVNHGDQITFVGKNFSQVSSIVLKPNITIEKSQFIDANNESFKVVVPDGAEAGVVILNTPKGEIQSKTMLNFNVAVVISSMTMEAKPGTNITITGSKINWINQVTFTSDVIVEQDDFVSQSETELVVTVPLDAQSGFLVFAFGGTDPGTFASDDELIVTLPEVTSIDPLAIRHTEELTINGSALDLITELVFAPGVSVLAADFTSQSESAITVSVPATAETGTITLKQASPLEITTADPLTITLPVGTDVQPVPAVPGTDNITITGTDLDLIAELLLPGGLVVTSGEFVSASMTEIVLAVPLGANSGGITYTTIHGYSNLLGANLIVPGTVAPLALTIFDDDIAFGGGNWSWGGTTDPQSTDQFYVGMSSFKHVQDGGDGGASVGGMSGIDASSYGTFVFSLFGGPGTDGLNVAAILNDQWGNYNTVTLVEGEWTEYRLDFSLYPDVDFSNVARWIFKPEGTSGGEILYVDRVGFDPAGPTPLPLTIFDDGPGFGGGDWSWGGVTDANSADQAYLGSTSFQHVQDGGDGGASVGGMSGIDASIYTQFSFSLYGGPGTDGLSVAAILNDEWGNYNSVTLVEGQWTEYSIDLANYPDIDLSDITRWIFKPEGTAGGEILHVDRVGFE